MKSMENFFNPHSVAIFASMKQGKTPILYIVY